MMEYRHYITLSIAVLAMQLFLYVFTRTVGWLFQLTPRSRKRLTVVVYVVMNSIILLHLFKIVSVFRPFAWVMVFLLFVFFVSSGMWVIYLLGKRRVSEQKWNNILRVSYPFALCGLIGLGLYNAYMPKITHYAITIEKPLKPLRIGVVSDLHLGLLFGGKQIAQLSAIFKAEKVDLILIPGDLIDDNVKAYLEEGMAAQLMNLRAPLGVYATLGNHDVMEAGHISKEMAKAGIQILQNRALTLNEQFILIGRNDDLYKNRPTTEKLLVGLNTKLPVFLMDHRPTDILKHSKLPIDLQVSGHTHHGQIFPANIITKWMYLLDYGYKKLGLGHYVVTSGYGFWGVPIRLGSQSEVVIIDIQGK